LPKSYLRESFLAKTPGGRRSRQKLILVMESLPAKTSGGRKNIIVGVGVVHVTGIILVLLKIIGPVEAAAIHLVPDTLVFINSIKLLRVKI